MRAAGHYSWLLLLAALRLPCLTNLDVQKIPEWLQMQHTPVGGSANVKPSIGILAEPAWACSRSIL
jgi:hypothetical protein